MKVFCKRFIVPLLLVFFISGAVIYSTVDIHTLKNLTAFQRGPSPLRSSA